VLVYTPPNETSHSIPLLRQPGLKVIGNIKVVNIILSRARERRIIQARVSNANILEGREGYVEPCIACNDIIGGLHLANS
jgi:hypothetical protein